jgi:hypothetical protein
MEGASMVQGFMSLGGCQSCSGSGGWSLSISGSINFNMAG